MELTLSRTAVRSQAVADRSRNKPAMVAVRTVTKPSP
jgi:hypothetical protein